MAVTIDTSTWGGYTEGTGETLTWSHTCTGTATTGLLVVGVGVNQDLWDPSSHPVTGVTYGGTGLTSCGAQADSHGWQLSLWYLKTPAVEAHDIVVTCSANNFIKACAVSYIGVDQSTPVSGYATASSPEADQLATATITSAVGDKVQDVVAIGNYGATTNGGTNRVTIGSDWNGSYIKCGGSYADGAASVAMAWDIATLPADWLIAGVNIKAAAGGDTFNESTSLAIVATVTEKGPLTIPCATSLAAEARDAERSARAHAHECGGDRHHGGVGARTGAHARGRGRADRQGRVDLTGRRDLGGDGDGHGRCHCDPA
jgi:hypothetical protein